MTLKFINEDTGALKTAVFCFTGKCPKTRPEMEAIAINAGAQVTASVNGRTTILVIADANSMSCKAESARDRDINLISPSQFFMMCGSVPLTINLELNHYFSPSINVDSINITSNSGYPISHICIKKPNPLIKPTEKRKHSLVRRIQL